MITSRALFLSIACLSLTACGNDSVPGKCDMDAPHAYTAPYDMTSCPADLHGWMERANGCGHFMGEEPYDAERRAFLKTQMDDLQCAALGCDYADLFRKYEGDIVYAGILTGYAEAVFGAVDNLPFCPQAGTQD